MVEEQGQERPGSTTELPGQDVLQALAALQVELSSEHEKNCRAYLHFMHKNHQRRKPDLARRCAIIQSIPYFWAIAVSFLLLLGVSAQEEEEVQELFPSSILASAVTEPSMVRLQGDLLLSRSPLLLEHSDHQV